MDELVKQLYIGCEKKCGKYFCCKELSDGNTLRISEILSKYGNIFLCCNVENVLNTNVESYYLIDFYFRILNSYTECACCLEDDNLIYFEDMNKNSIINKDVLKEYNKGNPEGNLKGNPEEVNNDFLKEYKKDYNDSNIDLNEPKKDINEYKENENNIKKTFIKNTKPEKPKHELKNADFCKSFFSKEFNEIEIFFLENILFLLLHHYNQQKDPFLRIIIIRIYNRIAVQMNKWQADLFFTLFYEIQSISNDLKSDKKSIFINEENELNEDFYDENVDFCRIIKNDKNFINRKYFTSENDSNEDKNRKLDSIKNNYDNDEYQNKNNDKYQDYDTDEYQNYDMVNVNLGDENKDIYNNKTKNAYKYYKSSCKKNFLKTDLNKNPEFGNKNFKFGSENSNFSNENSKIGKRKSKFGNEKSCFFNKKFLIKDYLLLIKNLKNKIKESSETIRSSESLEIYMKILSILNIINDKLDITSYNNFIIDLPINIKEEYRCYKAKQKNLFQFLNILAINIKSEFLKQRHTEMMKSKLQESFFRALFEGEISPYLTIVVRRNKLYQDTLRLFSKDNDFNATNNDNQVLNNTNNDNQVLNNTNNDNHVLNNTNNDNQVLNNHDRIRLMKIKRYDFEFKKQMRIVFENEEGIDSGGMTKEFFQLLSEDIINDRHSFVIKNNFLWINTSLCTCNYKENRVTEIKSLNFKEQKYNFKEQKYNKNNDQTKIYHEKETEQKIYKFCRKNYFKAIGRLLGISLYNDMVLNLPFPTFLFKIILNKKTDINDLLEIEPEIYNSLQKLKTLDSQSLENLDLRFSVDFEVNVCNNKSNELRNQKDLNNMNRDKENRDKENHDKENRDKYRDKENRDKENRDKENHDKENHDKEYRDKENHDKENHDKENHDKENRDNKDSADRDLIHNFNESKIPKEIVQVELIPNGENIKVTSKNINFFINKYVEFLTYTSIKENIDLLKDGFYDIINDISFLKPAELEKLIVGTNFFDIKFVKSHTVYDGYTEGCPIIKCFWELFEDDVCFQKKALQFITGSDRLPVSGFNSWKMVIMRNGCDTDRLPSSQTCFNTLLLPEYNTKEKFIEKFKSAVYFTKGFYLT
ncbi:Ubiquitin-protein ligase E3A [Dictyocoela muelleri]|nr:Ubiquitin-protein ligase E3A [Dictyocoela muelleri]